jgi:hypothetical protein
MSRVGLDTCWSERARPMKQRTRPCPRDDRLEPCEWASICERPPARAEPRGRSGTRSTTAPRPRAQPGIRDATLRESPISPARTRPPRRAARTPALARVVAASAASVLDFGRATRRSADPAAFPPGCHALMDCKHAAGDVGFRNSFRKRRVPDRYDNRTHGDFATAMT